MHINGLKGDQNSQPAPLSGSHKVKRNHSRQQHHAH
ncbi:small acid-soluble spore protein P [Bacillus canaveralius]|nr:small acid-soluble spore protein P [Bacillus canaveralius]RSK49657.1 small acid-soluble spore protein P [Bacillus canaveralius]